MPKHDSKALLGELILRADKLTKQDLATLIKCLVLKQGEPDEFAILQTAIREAGVLVSWQFFTQAERARVNTICLKVRGLLAMENNVRCRHVLLAGICRQAVRYAKERTGNLQRSHLLETLDTMDWTALLDGAFPGYPLELLGKALCGQLTGSRSAMNRE